MGKFKKGCAFILSTILAVSAMPSLLTEASWDYRYAGALADLYTPPEGYEAFEDTELYQNYSEYFIDGALHYRSIEHRQFFAAYYYYIFSSVELTVTNDGWEEIYNKYSEELDMDYAKLLEDEKTVRINDNINIGSCDYEDPRAEIQKRYNAIEEKFDTLMAMCSEMYEAGCITSAEYRPFSATDMPLRTSHFGVSYYAGTQEELEAAVKAVCEEAMITAYADGSYSVRFGYDGASAEDFFSTVDAVKALDGDHTVNVDIIVYEETGGVSAPELGNGSLDVITLLQESYAAGDINVDGETDLTDAVLILQSYAESAATGAAAADMMDTNDDGSVNIDDAAKVLEMYAQNAAGLNAS